MKREPTSVATRDLVLDRLRLSLEGRTLLTLDATVRLPTLLVTYDAEDARASGGEIVALPVQGSDGVPTAQGERSWR